jgi:hypothetical protein
MVRNLAETANLRGFSVNGSGVVIPGARSGITAWFGRWLGLGGPDDPVDLALVAEAQSPRPVCCELKELRSAISPPNRPRGVRDVAELFPPTTTHLQVDVSDRCSDVTPEQYQAWQDSCPVGAALAARLQKFRRWMFDCGTCACLVGPGGPLNPDGSCRFGRCTKDYAD